MAGSTLETERLLLRPFQAGDFGAMFAIYSRSDVAEYLLWDARTEAQTRATLEKRIAARSIEKEGDFMALAAALKTTGELIGDLVLGWTSEEHRTGEVGFIVHPDHQGRGYATEAMRAVLDLAFDDMKLHRVIGQVESRNAASERVLEKLGFRKEAHFVENVFVKGGWQSEMIYAILDREWRGTRR